MTLVSATPSWGLIFCFGRLGASVEHLEPQQLLGRVALFVLALKFERSRFLGWGEGVTQVTKLPRSADQPFRAK